MESQGTKLVPRVYVDGGQSAFFQSIGSNREHFRRTVALIVELVRGKGFDGIVWDSPYNFFERSRESLNGLIADLLVQVREELPKDKEILFNMANPMNHMNSLDL